MYYSSVSRIMKLQKMVERIAFISVGADIMIAGSTYLVIRNAPFSNSLLMVSDYLDLALVVMVVAMFSMLLLLRFSIDIDKKTRMFIFRLSHRRQHRPEFHERRSVSARFI